MKNVPWYIQDDKDDIIDLLEDKKKQNTNIAGSLGHKIKTTAVLIASQVISTSVKNILKKNESVLDTAVRLQEIDLYTRTEIHFYMGEKSNHILPYMYSSSSPSSQSSSPYRGYKSQNNDSNSSISSESIGGSVKNEKNQSFAFLEGVKNIFGERQQHASKDLLWKKTEDNVNWYKAKGWRDQLINVGWNGICQSKIGKNYIKKKINLLETGDGIQLVLVVLYKSDKPVWKLSDDGKNIVATNLNDPLNGMVVGFVFFKELITESRVWTKNINKYCNAISTRNYEDNKKGNENIVIKTTRHLKEEFSYIDLICVAPFLGPKVNKNSHNFSVRGTYLFLLIYAITKKQILLNSIEDAFMWYLKLGGHLIINPVLTETDLKVWADTIYFSDFVKKCKDLDGKRYFLEPQKTYTHPWWYNKALVNNKPNHKNRDFAEMPILTDYEGLPYVYFPIQKLNELYQNGNSNHFRARKNWDKVKKNMAKIRLLKQDLKPLEVVAEGLNIKIPGAKKCKTLKKKYKKTCQGKKKNENTMRMNKTCKKLKRKMKKLYC